MRLKQILFLLVLLVFPIDANATVITVGPHGCDFTTIQAGIDAAEVGDIVEVIAETYYENVNINKPITLRGLDMNGSRPIVDARKQGSAIKLNSNDIILEGFVVTNSGAAPQAGVEVMSHNNTIRDIIAKGCEWCGIFTYKSSYNNIIDNIANYNSVGFVIELSGDNIVKNNTANYNTVGINLRYSGNNIVFGNNANNNQWSGIFLEASSGNEIAYNYAGHNNDHGIQLKNSDDNIIHDNNLVNNMKSDASDDSGNNQWDDGAVGNYYSDFHKAFNGCKDANADSICDSAYEIPGGSFRSRSLDRYPLATSR
jgi:parallel beta-helix repeat protein